MGMLTDPATGLGVGPAGPRPEPADAVGPLIRGIAVIRALTEAGGALGLPELSRETDLARSSVDRIIATLGAFGYVRFHRREVTLAPRLMELGNAYLRSVRIPALLGPLARELSERLDEVVTLTVTDEAGAFLVHEAVRPRKLAIVCHVGDHLPLDRCAGGALYAATWDDEHWQAFRTEHECTQDHGDPRLCAEELRRRAEQARERGWALDDQWLEPGLVAVGIPVHGPDGVAVCEVNVLSFTGRHAGAAELADEVMPELRATVRRMEEALRTAPRTGPRELPDGVREVPSDSGIESLARGLTMLTAFSEARPDVSIADAARVTGLPRATARRALITLEHLGYLSQTRGRYRPNATVLWLGYPVLTRLTLGQIAAPHLEALSARVGHSASMAVLHGDTEIMYVARAATATRLMTVDIHVGTRLPSYATSMGRVLLASLPADLRAKALRAARPTQLTPHTTTGTRELLELLQRVGEDGFAAVDEELEVGLRSIAVPITGHDGGTVAAVNVAMHAGTRGTQDGVAAMLPALRAAAQAVHHDLATIGPFHRIAPM
jgi:IclR family pca regulon transcriptional regulator